MRRRDLLKQIRQIADDQGLAYGEQEGARHTKIYVGDRQTVVPRHNEINEITARAIIKQISEGTE